MEKEKILEKMKKVMRNNLLTQIADILMRLYPAGTKVLKELKQTIKNPQDY